MTERIAEINQKKAQIAGLKEKLAKQKEKNKALSEKLERIQSFPLYRLARAVARLPEKIKVLLNGQQ